MLQQMRAFSKSWISSLFLGALALSFALWGIADIFRVGGDTNVVTVGETQVPYETFARDYRNFVRSQSQQMGKELTPEQARRMGLGNVMLEQVINRSAIDNVVGELGLTVSDADVSANIRKMSVFNGPLGGFDRDTFQRALQQRGYGENEFVEIMRADMARSQLLDPLGAGFQVPPGYAHALFTYSTEQRAAEYIVLTAAALGPIAPPSDAILSAYVKARPERFSTPEYRAVSYADIGPDDVKPSLKVSDERLHQEYDARKDTYVVPEKRDVEQITFRDEAGAKAARAKIDGGMGFDAVAKAQGVAADNLGSVVAADLGTRGPAVFALANGGVTAPLKNFSGWVLMHVTKITPGSSKSFDQAKPELTKLLLDQLAQAKIGDIANAFTDAVSGGANIKDAARKAGMHFGHVAAVDAQGLAPDGSRAAAPLDPDFLAQVFSAEVGEAGDPFQSRSTGHTYAIAVEGVTPPKVKSLDAVRAAATQAWIKERGAVQLRMQASLLAEQARQAGGLAAIAQKLGTPVQSGPALTRQSSNELFSPELIAALFRVPPNGVVSGPTGKADSYIIARVTGVAHPPLPLDNPGYQQSVSKLAGQFGDDIAVTLASAARAKQGVKTNQKLVDQATGGEGS